MYQDQASPKESRKIHTVCFTGHRNILQSDAVKMPSVLFSLIEQLFNLGATHFRTGGAMGFDTVAALCVLEAKQIHPEIKLDLILPCKDQTSGWTSPNVLTYNYILSQASSFIYICNTYRKGCMHERNRALVDGSQCCIAYLYKNSGGSAYTYSYAVSSGLEVINIRGTLSTKF